MNVTQSDQAGPDDSDVVKNDETVVHNGSMEMESDSDEIYVPFSSARSKHANVDDKQSIAGPSANRYER